MSDGISIVGSTPGATASANTAPATPRAADPSAFAVNTNVSISPPPLLQNPRIVQDPSAGVITEYLNTNGTQVVSQSPSAVTVYYLHQGLTANGLPKQTNDHINTTA